LAKLSHSKASILQTLRDNERLIESLGVKRLGLFGSFLRGEEQQTSDVDFLVEFQPEKKTFDNFIRLSFLLEDLLRRRVELVTPESLSPYIGPKTLREVEYVTFVT